MAHAEPHAPTEHGDLPFFVYGTLQTGYGNHDNVVRGRLSAAVPACVRGMRVYHLVGFPGMFEDESRDSTVEGQLLYIPREHYDAVMLEMDELEAYAGPGRDNMYDRVLVDVYVCASTDTDAPPVRAWTYLCRIPLSSTPHTYIAHGDWRRFMSEHGLAAATDDWSHNLSHAQTHASTTTTTGAAEPGEHAACSPTYTSSAISVTPE